MEGKRMLTLQELLKILKEFEGDDDSGEGDAAKFVLYSSGGGHIEVNGMKVFYFKNISNVHRPKAPILVEEPIKQGVFKKL
jgi:hypothetical protein